MQPIANRLESHRSAVRAECAKRGIRITQHGEVLHLWAPGVDMVTTDLSWIRIEDLAPVGRGTSNL